MLCMYSVMVAGYVVHAKFAMYVEQLMHYLEMGVVDFQTRTFRHLCLPISKHKELNFCGRKRVATTTNSFIDILTNHSHPTNIARDIYKL
jgi:hypothetical protein